MTRVFYRSCDPTDDKAGDRLIYKGTGVCYNVFGVITPPGGEVSTYGQPDTRSEQESTDLIPWHRVDHIEGYPR